MKRLFMKFIWYNPSWVRLQRIQNKKADRLKRLRLVVNELREWDDIPISWQFTSICSTLKIKPNAAAKQFIFELCVPDVDIDQAAKKLPLILNREASNWASPIKLETNMKKGHVYLIWSELFHSWVIAIGTGRRGKISKDRHRYETQFITMAFLPDQVFEIGKL